MMRKRSRFATDQEPVKSRRESERRPTQEMTGPSLFNKGISTDQDKRLEAGRSPCNKAQQLSSFESEQEHGKRRCTPPVYFKDYDTDGMGLDLCPESSRWTCRCPQHIQPRNEKDLEEDASFHRPAPVMSEDED
ncbi:hypothetical protein CAPTEDRAFT_201368 [Capitella teleta]|uniref:Uncharacterized protein n=1 Tax=Capitella teleta TaxID=283909 RepID=R7VDW1_CAPTE|nr:hypothetical protein CAPTEDRAFT_201368 [Capitella teleta]|eukprot:ELU17033.1 hypothetical protein CAPTEDRAFT_201368 [Capitella teleta]